MGKPITVAIEKIAKECEEAGASKWTITKIVKELQGEAREGKELRGEALRLLQQLDPKAAAVYASFQRMQVRTSSEKIEAFDRGNIIKSLLRETNVPRGVAEKIGHDVEEKIKDLEIEHISTALIREMVNVRLLEYGHEAIRNQYTRIGLPVFEVRKKIERQPYSNRAIMTEYNLLTVIPPKMARLHLRQELYIAALPDFSTKVVAASLVPKPGEKPRETALGAVKEMNRLSRAASWAPNIAYLNAALAVGAKRGRAREAAEIFFKGTEAAFLGRSAVQGTALLCLFEPEEFGDAVEKNAMASAANSLLSMDSEKGFPLRMAVAVDSKYKLKLLGKPAGEMLVVNNRDREFQVLNGIPAEGKGICSFIGINAMLDALGNAGNEAGFFSALAEKAGAVKKLDRLKREKLAKRLYLERAGIQVGEVESAVGIPWLGECAEAVLPEGNERERLQLCEKIVSELKKELGAKFIVAELCNRHALHLFTAKNRKVFGARENGKGLDLAKSSFLQKNFCFTAGAGSRKELAKLLDSNAKLIEMRLSGGK